MNENNLNNGGITPTPVQQNNAPTPTVASVAPVEPVVSAPINNVAETVTPTPNGKKSNPIVVILLVLVLIGVCVYGLYTYTDVLKPKTKTAEVTTTTSVEITTTAVITPLSKEATDKIEKSLNNTFHDTDIVSGKEYLEDYDFKFAYLVYFYSWDDTNLSNVSEDGSTGSFIMDLDTFKGYYLKAYGEQFDITKLDNTSTFYTGVKFPNVDGNKIKSSFYTGPDIEKYQYEYESNSYSEGLYTLTFKYGTSQGVDDRVVLTQFGTTNLKVSVDPKGFISYKSLVSSK